MTPATAEAVATAAICGGCLCGRLRYQATGDPIASGLCFCADCRKASGSAFIPFMAFPAGRLVVEGDVRAGESLALSGGAAVRSRCAACGSLVFGGRLGADDTHTIYAGSLDDPDKFRPTIAIFVRDRPAWATIPDGLATFATMPDAA